MAVNKRLGAVFLSGLLLGAAAVARGRKQPGSAGAPLPVPRQPQPAPPQPAASPSTPQFPRSLPEFEFGPDEPLMGVLPARADPPKPRYLVTFAFFFVLAALALAGAWMGLGLNSLPGNDRLAATKALPAPGPVAKEGPALSACPLQPAIAPAGEKDGQFPLQADVSGLTATDIGSFLVIGKQSSAAGRPRDAETAFLMACRVADKVKGAGSVESADARYQLAAHYAALALAGTAPAGVPQAEWLQRAEGLYADSLPAYLATYGESSAPLTQAAQGLSAVRQALGQPAPGNLPAPALAPASAGPAMASQEAAISSAPLPESRQVDTAKAAADRPQSSQRSGTPQGDGPSFDCRRARSSTEKMICSDAELARLDRELGRAYERAKKATSDPSAFRRQSDLEWRRRETMCQDRGCLLRWYAYRRAQLVSVIDGREQALPEERR